MTTTLDDRAAATSGGSTSIPRDRWGRPMVKTLDGKMAAYTRATTFVGAIDDLYGLMGWKQRQTAVGLAARQDLLLRAASLGPQPVDEKEKRTWKAKMDEVCEQAMEASASSAAATIGTALHEYTEAIDHAKLQGRTWAGAVPAEYRGHLDAYREATATWTVHHIEEFLVLDDLMIGGTADRIVTVPTVDGLVIADLKTGSVEYPHKMAMQLAVYAHSQIYNPETGERTPIPNINQQRGLIIALDAKTGACTPLWIDIASGWEAVRLAAKVREWRAKKNLTAPAAGELKPVKGQRVAADQLDETVIVALDVAVANARSQKELLAIAEAAKAHDRWSAELNAAAGARWASLPAA